MLSFLLLCICLVVSCKKSNPTEVINTGQNEIHSWSEMTNGLPTNTAYTIASIGSKLYVYAGNKLFSSSDNGGSWISVGAGLPDSTWINGIAGINNNLAAATDGSGVFTSSDFGVTWLKPVNNGLNADAQSVRSILMTSEFLFIGAGNDASVYRSSDFGASWISVSNGFPVTTQEYFPRIYLLIGNDSLLYACPYASGIYLSKTNGSNWQSMNGGLPYQPYVSNFAISDSFYFTTIWTSSVVEQGLYRRTFNSQNWMKIADTLTISPPNFVVAQGSTVILSTGQGIEISFDKGNNWSACNQGLGNDFATLAGFHYAVIQNDYVFAISDHKGVWRYSIK